MSNKKSHKNNNIHRRTCLVIGATGGVGRAVVDKLIANDFEVIIVGKEMDALCALSKRYPSKNLILRIRCNLNQPEKIKDMLVVVKDKIGQISCIVNCAGVFMSDDACISSKKILNEMINVNFTSNFLLLEMAYALGVVSSGGAIVNISSVRGRIGSDGQAKIYSALKAGLINLTKSFAYKYARSGSRINCIAPGPIYPTKMSEKWDNKKKKEIIKNTPLGFMAEPKNIADVVYFLISSGSSGMTGETIDVNGGTWMN